MMQNGSVSEIWETELSLKAINTQRKYRQKFNSFLDRWDTTPEELYETRLSDLRSGDPLSFRRIEKMVETQMSEMVKDGKSPSTAKQLKKAVSLFFEAVNLPLQMKAKNMPNGDSLGQKMMRADQIRALIENQNRLNRKRNKAIILTLKDTGLRVSDVQLLTVEAYEMAETISNEIGEPFKRFDPEITRKCKVKAFIHLGPESIQAVEAYLEERREKGEIEDKPTLFINRQKAAFEGDSMGNMISIQCRLFGKKFIKLSAHSLRKFHKTMLQKGRVPNDWIDKLQGKTPDTYSRPEEGGAPEDTGDLTEAYIKAYEFLRVYGVPEELKRREEERRELEREKLEKEAYEMRDIVESLIVQVEALTRKVEDLSRARN